MSNEYKYNPLSESGKGLPNVKAVADKTIFVDKTGHKKFYMAMDGLWERMNLTPDDDAVFKSLTVDRLFAKNIYATSVKSVNGGLIVSDSAMVEKAYADNFEIKNDGITGLNPFVLGDLLYSATFKPDLSVALRELRMVVTEVAGNTVYFDYSSESGVGIPAQVGVLQDGDTVVRVGNLNLGTYPERGSVVTITLNDERDMGAGSKNYAPYIKVLNAVDSFDDFFNGQPQAMLGNLGTIVDASFPTNAFITPTTGAVGLYTKNGFFKGKIYLADEDLLGDITLGKTYRSATDPALTNVIKEGDLWIGTGATNRFRTQVWVGNPSDDPSPGSWQDYLPGIWDAPTGDGLLITSQYMGYYDNSSFKTYIKDDGSFYFAGYDANHYITWDGSSAELTIAGKVLITNEQDFVKNPVTYIQATDPILTNTIYEGTLWYNSTVGVKKWYKWIGARSTYAIPGYWEEQSWGTYIANNGIYTGTITAGQITTGTLDAQTITLGTATTDGVIQSYDYVANTSGWKIAKGIAEFNNGDINFNTGGYTLAINSPSIDFTDTTFGTSSYIEHRITSGNKADLYLNASTGGRITLSASEIFLSGNIGTWGGAIVESPTSGYFRFNGAKFVWDTPTLSESDPVYTASSWYGTTNNSANWNTAYGWGNHASAGYIVGSKGNLTNTSGLISITGGANAVIGSGTSLELNYNTDDFLVSSTTLRIKNVDASKVTTGSGGNSIAYFNGSSTLALGSVSSPLAISAGALSIPVATSSANGYLSSTDWSTFNGKSTVSISGTDSFIKGITLSEGTLNVYGRTLTINGTGYTVLTNLELV